MWGFIYTRDLIQITKTSVAVSANLNQVQFYPEIKIITSPLQVSDSHFCW